jgi:hypothetical protein
LLNGETYVDVPLKFESPPLNNIKWERFGIPTPRAMRKRLSDFPIDLVSENIIPIELSPK